MTKRPVDLLNALVGTRGTSAVRDIAYGPHARNRLDLWRPDDGRDNLPVLMFFYGGAWQEGARADYAFVAASLARAGFLVVVPDYRVHPEVSFPAFLGDCAEAVATARRLAREHGGDPAQLILMGHSAGAHIAAMLALDRRWGARPAGMVGLAGPYDFLPILGADIRAVFAPAADPRDTQPIHFAGPHAPPMLLLHGARDRIVWPRNALALAARLDAAGARAEARILPGIGHIGIVLAIARPFRFLAPVLDATARFAADITKTTEASCLPVPSAAPA
jgi:acetyl esterase/lipase